MTLLELFIGLAVIALISGTLIFASRSALEKRKFTSNVALLTNHLQMVQRVALNTQIDYIGTLSKDKESQGWIFAVQGMDSKAKKIRPLHLNSFALFNNKGKELNEVVFEFFSSGAVSPATSITLRLGDLVQEVKMPGREEGDGKKRGGPLHPAQQSRELR